MNNSRPIKFSILIAAVVAAAVVAGAAIAILRSREKPAIPAAAPRPDFTVRLADIEKQGDRRFGIFELINQTTRTEYFPNYRTSQDGLPYLAFPANEVLQWNAWTPSVIYDCPPWPDGHVVVEPGEKVKFRAWLGAINEKNPVRRIRIITLDGSSFIRSEPYDLRTFR